MNQVKLSILADGRLMVCFPKNEMPSHYELRKALGALPSEKYSSQGNFNVHIIGEKPKKGSK